jgi:hypothetical protein
MAQLTYSSYNSATVEGDQKLAVEISHSYVVLVLGTPAVVAGIEYFEADDNDLEELLNHVKHHSQLMDRAYSEARIYYNLDECVLVPAAGFNTAIATELMDLAFGSRASCRINVENINIQPGIVNVYRSKDDWQEIISRYFRAVTKRHLLSKLVEDSIRANKELTAIFYKDSITIIAAPGQHLHMARNFPYSNKADVLYHLLNTCKQTGIMANETPLNLGGLIREGSPVFDMLGKYFGALIIDDSLPALPGDPESHVAAGNFSHFYNLLA